MKKAFLRSFICICTMVGLNAITTIAASQSSAPQLSVSSLNDIEINESLSSVQFRHGRFTDVSTSAQKAQSYKQLYSDTLRTYIATDPSNRVEAIWYECTFNDTATLLGVKCGDNTKVVRTLLGKSLIIKCKKNEDSDSSKDPQRAFFSKTDNIQLFLRRDSVVSFAVTRSAFKESNDTDSSNAWVNCQD
jgi:hypothetical protein